MSLSDTRMHVHVGIYAGIVRFGRRKAGEKKKDEKDKTTSVPKQLYIIL